VCVFLSFIMFKLYLLLLLCATQSNRKSNKEEQIRIVDFNATVSDEILLVVNE